MHYDDKQARRLEREIYRQVHTNIKRSKNGRNAATLSVAPGGTTGALVSGRRRGGRERLRTTKVKSIQVLVQFFSTSVCVHMTPAVDGVLLKEFEEHGLQKNLLCSPTTKESKFQQFFIRTK